MTGEDVVSRTTASAERAIGPAEQVHTRTPKAAKRVNSISSLPEAKKRKRMEFEEGKKVESERRKQSNVEHGGLEAKKENRQRRPNQAKEKQIQAKSREDLSYFSSSLLPGAHGGTSFTGNRNERRSARDELQMPCDAVIGARPTPPVFIAISTSIGA